MNQHLHLRACVVLGAAIMCALVFRLWSLQVDARRSMPDAEGLREDAEFFAELVGHGVIRPRAGSQVLEIVPVGFAHDLHADRDENSTAEESERTGSSRELFASLHSSIVGRAVSAAVQAWNNGHVFAGVRDNRPRSAADRPNDWEIRDAALKSLRVQEGIGIPEFCVFVTDGKMRPGFGDWVRAYGAHDVRLSTSLELREPFRLVVQIVGTVKSVSPSPVEHHARGLAGENFGNVNSTSPNPGAELLFDLPAGRHELEIVVTPAMFQIDVMPGLNIAWDSAEPWPRSVSWKPLETMSSSFAPVPFAISTADGVSLVDAAGKAGDNAWELGLSSLTGLDAADRYSLEWILSAAPEVGSVTLTIDSRMQRAALRQLERHVARLSGDEYCSRMRRGGVVLMDADSGAILAAASWPNPRPDVHVWDVHAFSSYYYSRDWRTFRPWKGLDGNNAPGSTFKPVSALAAIKAVQDGVVGADEIQRFMTGVTAAELKKAGLHPDCVAYDAANGIQYNKAGKPIKDVPPKFPKTTAIKNFKREPMHSYFDDGQEIGLAQAVCKSANVWFVRLAQLVDGPVAERYDVQQDRGPWPAFRLGDMAAGLGFQRNGIDLLSNLPASIPTYRLPPRGTGDGDVMYAQPGMPRILGPRGDAVLQSVLAQNSIGQAVTASPLQIARVAAAIATAKLPVPHLVARYNDDELDSPASLDFGLNSGSRHNLGLLREGMKMVVEKGTAKEAFSKFREKHLVYGKTGTANIEKPTNAPRAFISTWFMGWREPAEKGQRRIAFACYVSHMDDKSDSGGKVAAPLIKGILSELDNATLNFRDGAR